MSLELAIDDKAPINIVDSLIAYLKEQNISFEVIKHPFCASFTHKAHLCNIPLSALVRVLLLQDKQGMVMLSLPAPNFLELDTLQQKLGRELNILPEKAAQEIFSGCMLNAYPPLPEFYKLQAIVEEELSTLEALYIMVGTHDTLLKITPDAFKKIQKNAWQFHFSEPLNIQESTETYPRDSKAPPLSFTEMKSFLSRRFKIRIEDTAILPAMPAMIEGLLKIRVNPNADAFMLASLLEQDPSLSAQVIAWASAPYYGFRGNLTSVAEAIIKVLGFDLVMNLVLGLALTHTKPTPKEGPLGLLRHWEEALYTASLIECLIREMPLSKRPARGLAYLCGLLHNFGYLLLGWLFPPQYELLSKSISANPELPRMLIEHSILGVGHEELGAWLMHAWNMPSAICASVRWHHNLHYQGEDAVYVHLVLLAKELLRQQGVGEAFEIQLTDEWLSGLHLTQQAANKAFNHFWAGHDTLNDLMQTLAR